MTAAVVGEWARLLLGSLAQSGVTDVVVSPGSRSTPFAWAAAAASPLTCHSLWDERSAAFFALGLARASGRAPLLISTSGTAAANYFPAVIEAALARVPLLLLTADRPLELQDTAAPQTIDQVRLYGRHAKFFDLGAPEIHRAALAGLQRIAAQAALAARHPEAGPVHLNARARKPLEPALPHNEVELELATEVDRLLERGVPHTFAPDSAPTPEALTDLAARLSRARRGIVVCGPLGLEQAGAVDAIQALAERLDMPLYAEATSQLRFPPRLESSGTADGLDWLLRTPSGRAGLRPDFVLRFGGPPASAGLERLLSEGSTELAVVGGYGFSDPTSAATVFVLGPPALAAHQLLERIDTHRPSSDQHAYAELMARANVAVWRAVEPELSSPTLDEPHAVRLAVAALPPRGVLVVGNSLPVREVDAFVRARSRGLSVVSQRGANGIDGLVSGAAGTALALSLPTLLLIGDVSFAHDLGGLAAARLVKTPLALVVLDNDGGRMFEQLPLERLFKEHPERSELWLTPPRLALEHAAGLFGLPYAAPATPDELTQELRLALERTGASVVHVRVSPHGARDAVLAVTERLEEGLRELLASGEPA